MAVDCGRLHSAPPRVEAALVLALSLFTASRLAGQEVTEKNGSIFFIDTNGRVARLTDSDLDFAPTLSPDRQLVAFARRTPGELVATGLGDVEAGEIWLIHTDGSGAKRLARGAARDPWEETLAGLSNPQFLSDSRRVLFQSVLWATSGKVSIVDIRSATVRRLVPGSLDAVIHDGKYRDHLIVSQHRYFLGTGSYDWWWLFDASGKEIGPIGSDESQVEIFKEMHVPGFRRRTPTGH